MIYIAKSTQSTVNEGNTLYIHTLNLKHNLTNNNLKATRTSENYFINFLDRQTNTHTNTPIHTHRQTFVKVKPTEELLPRFLY